MENKLYCIECGFENKAEDKFCGKCGRSLTQQDDELKNYILNKAKSKAGDEVKDRATNAFLDFLQKFLNSKAYGMLLSLSVVTGIGTVIAGGTGYIEEFSGYPSGVFIDGTSFHSSTSAPLPTPDVTLPPEDTRIILSFGRFTIVGTYEDELLKSLELLPTMVSGGENIPDVVTITDIHGNTLLETTVKSYNIDSGVEEPSQFVNFTAGTIEVTSVIEGIKRRTIVEYDQNSVLRKTVIYVEDRIQEIREYFENGNMQYHLEVNVMAEPGEVQNFWEYRYDEEGRKIQGNNCYGDPTAGEINIRWRTDYEYTDKSVKAYTYNGEGIIDNYSERDVETDRLILEIYYNKDGTESSRYEY